MNQQTNQGNGSNIMIQGRIVWTNGSNLFEGKQVKDYDTNQLKIGADGNPITEYGFGLAVPKGTEAFNQLWQLMYQEAYTIYPSGQLPPDFAMKFKDGDTDVDYQGQPYSKREGYPGHIVIACTTRLPIKYFVFEGGNNILVNTGIKCGDYVNVQLNIKAHPAKGRGKAGLYMNPSAVQLVAPGQEIINTPSGDQIFGQNAPSYAGQMVADTAPQMPNVAPQTAPAPQAPAQPAQAPAPMPQTAPAPAQPHYGVLPSNMQPNQTGQAPAPQAPAPQSTPAPMPQAPAGAPPVQNNVQPAVPPMPGYQQ